MSTPQGFQAYRTTVGTPDDPRPARPWDLDEWGLKWEYANGTIENALATAARYATLARFLSRCPTDALGYHGDELGWPKVPGETDAEFRARLLKSWHLAKWRGTKRGIIDALAFLGLPGGDIKEGFDPLWGRNPTGLTADQRARHFWVIIYHPHPFGTDFSFRYGDGTTYGALPTGSGKLWGVNGDPRLIELVRDLVRRMRPAHAYCADIIVPLAGTFKQSGAADDGDPSGPTDRIAYLGGV